MSVCLSEFCLSRTYIGPKSRTERPRKTKIGKEVAHITRDSDTTFKVKRSNVKVTRPLWLAVLAGQHLNRVSDRSICVYDVYRVTICRPGRGRIVAASRLQLVQSRHAYKVPLAQVNQRRTGPALEAEGPSDNNA